MNKHPSRDAGPNSGWPTPFPQLLMAAMACWTTFACTAILMVTGYTARVDAWSVLAFRDAPELTLSGPEWWSVAIRDMTALGGFPVRNLLAIMVIAILLTLRRQRQVLVLLTAIVSGMLLEYWLKECFGRPRPAIVPHLMPIKGNSFPSGHVFNGSVVYISIALAFAGMSWKTATRLIIMGAAIVACILIGLTRVALGVHFLTDAAAGLVGGAGWALLVYALLSSSPRNPQATERTTYSNAINDII